MAALAVSVLSANARAENSFPSCEIAERKRPTRGSGGIFYFYIGEVLGEDQTPSLRITSESGARNVDRALNFTRAPASEIGIRCPTIVGSAGRLRELDGHSAKWYSGHVQRRDRDVRRSRSGTASRCENMHHRARGNK